MHREKSIRVTPYPRGGLATNASGNHRVGLIVCSALCGIAADLARSEASTSRDYPGVRVIESESGALSVVLWSERGSERATHRLKSIHHGGSPPAWAMSGGGDWDDMADARAAEAIGWEGDEVMLPLCPRHVTVLEACEAVVLVDDWIAPGESGALALVQRGEVQWHLSYKDLTFPVDVDGRLVRAEIVGWWVDAEKQVVVLMDASGAACAVSIPGGRVVPRYGIDWGRSLHHGRLEDRVRAARAMLRVRPKEECTLAFGVEYGRIENSVVIRAVMADRLLALGDSRTGGAGRVFAEWGDVKDADVVEDVARQLMIIGAEEHAVLVACLKSECGNLRYILAERLVRAGHVGRRLVTEAIDGLKPDDRSAARMQAILRR